MPCEACGAPQAPYRNRRGWMLCSNCQPEPNEDHPEPEPMRATNKDNLPATRRACSKCGRLGHLARTCTRPERAHLKIGVEVEGWWRDLAATKREADNWRMSGTTDGSLNDDNTGETEAYEFRTRPGSLGEAISQVKAIYPDKCDPSAGMHVHMSFRDVHDVTCLASMAFVRFFRARWEAWGTRMGVHRDSDFWSRLRGENRSYCAENTESDQTTRNLTRNRYRQLNFCSYARHKTLECRMLPLFRDARLAISALEEWVAIVEDFLTEQAPAVLSTLDREVEVATPGASEGAIMLARTEEVQIGTIEAPSEAEVSLAPVTEDHGVLPIEVYSAPIPEERTGMVYIQSTEPPPAGHVRIWGPSRNRRIADIVRDRLVHAGY